MRRGRSATVQTPEEQSTKSTLDCVCGKSYATTAALSQHQRLYCKGPNPDFSCKICGAFWEKNQSLGQHMRHAHPVEYSNMIKDEAKKKKNRVWLPSEVSEMARAEAYYGGTQLNSFLVEFTGRSLDSVKGRRKYQEYRDLVKTFNTIREQGSSSTFEAVQVDERHQDDLKPLQDEPTCEDI